jgi:hypothetical protein
MDVKGFCSLPSIEEMFAMCLNVEQPSTVDPGCPTGESALG